MHKVFDKDIKLKLEQIYRIIAKKYRPEHPIKKKDWSIYKTT